MLSKKAFTNSRHAELVSASSCLIKQGFTLIELLVVVLIIGILAAVAVSQYQKAAEKARMAEAVVNVRAIANAHQLYHLATGSYLGSTEIDKLDISIPGTIDNSWGAGRIKTKDFIYSPGVGSTGGGFLALVQRVQQGDNNQYVYYISILSSDPQRIRCYVYPTGSATAIQKKLCEQLDANGTL